MKKDSIGDRMKNNYEDRYRLKLTRRTPVIIRLDGKSFHKLTKHCNKPFDVFFNNAMVGTAIRLYEEIQGAKCAYVQSDEISILITDFDRLMSCAWFDYNIQKIVSVSSGLASVEFSSRFHKAGIFDCRAFNIPKEEVCNYFIWRQQDCIKNSVQMLARKFYTHKELHEKSQSDMHEMIYNKGVNWADLSPRYKNGTFISYDIKKSDRWTVTSDIIFSRNRDVVEQLLLSLECKIVSEWYNEV